MKKHLVIRIRGSAEILRREWKGIWEKEGNERDKGRKRVNNENTKNHSSLNFNRLLTLL
jgi:hypothetical protein